MGKGKTSTLNGSAVRAKGAGMKVLLFRFLKGVATSEDTPLNQLGITIYKTQTSKKFVIQMNDEEKNQTKEELKLSLEDLRLMYQNYDVIILDEFLDLMVDNVSLLKEGEAIELLTELKQSGKEIMVSGHYKLNKLFKLADLVTHYTPEKHYYEQGQKARKGIEY